MKNANYKKAILEKKLRSWNSKVINLITIGEDEGSRFCCGLEGKEEEEQGLEEEGMSAFWCGGDDQ